MNAANRRIIFYRQYLVQCTGLLLVHFFEKRKRKKYMGASATKLGMILCATSLIWACATAPVKEEREYFFFPPPPQTPRIQFLTSISGEQDFVIQRSSFADFVIGKKQKVTRTVRKPYGVAIKDGIIYVCDTRVNKIDVLDLPAGEFRYIWGSTTLKFKKPVNIAVDDDGTKYIADTVLDSVIVLDSSNRFVTALGSKESMKPTDVVLFGNKVFVVDVKNAQVVVFEKGSGRLLYRIGAKGNEPGTFATPTNIAVDDDGNIYVSETGGFRIQKLTQEGEPLKIFGGGIGDGLAQFARPRGVAVDREGRIYSVDGWHSVVQVFDAEGRFLLFFGEMGNQPGNLILPAQIVIDYDNVPLFTKYASPDFEIEYLIIVTSQYGERKVNVLGFGQKRTEDILQDEGLE
jgi:sugar lactone lactonase YvrE